MILKLFLAIICFILGAFFGFFSYSVTVAYLIEQNLPNHNIAEGFSETLMMILLIGSLRIGESDEYFISTVIILIFGILFSFLPIWLLRPKNTNKY